MPASTLESQLQRIAVAAGVRAPQPSDPSEREYDPVGIKGKASLVYSSYQDAAEVGLEEVYELGLKGFDALCRLDPRFQSCRQALFSQSTAVSFERGAWDAERLRGIDNHIDRFCRLVGPYFLLPAATRALEYLVRKFQVHENNVYALMKAALPYHGTAEFVRCVMIMRLKKTCFEFLSPMKKSPPKGGLSRESLVQRCITDRALLRFVCDMARELSDPKTGVRSCMGWYAVVLCEYIGCQEATVDEDFIAFLLPYIIHGVQGQVVTEYRDATYMVLGQLASRAQFSDQVFHELLPDITGSCTPGSLPQVLLLLGYLASSQDCFSRLPEKCYEHLSRLPTLFSELKQLTSKMPHSHALGYLLFLDAAQHALDKDEHVDSYSMLVKSLQMGPHMGRCADFLLGMAKKPVTGDQQARLVGLVKEFDLHHGNVLEKALNDYLAIEGNDSEERSCLMGVLGKSLEDTVRAPLGNANVTLAAGVDHASAGVRIMALEKLNDIYKSDGSMKEESETILKGALLRRLHDDDFGVVLTTLNLDQLPDLIPGKLLVENLMSCIERCMEVIYSKQSGKKSRGLARKSAKVALQHVASLQEDKTLLVGVLLSVLLAGAHSHKLSLTSLELLVQNKNTVLSKVLGPVYEKYSIGTLANGAKRSKTGGAASHIEGFDADVFNQTIIESLSNAVLKGNDARDALCEVLLHESTSPSAKAVIACIMESACMTSGGKDTSKKDAIAQKVIQWFYNEADEPLLSRRRKSEAFKSLWDSRKKSLSSQSLSDVASRSTDLCAIEPELLLACLSNISEKAFQKMSNPTPMELYAYLASLSSNVWFQHLGALLEKLEDPVDSLINVWEDACLQDTTLGTTAVVALKQWSEHIASQKLSGNQKKSVSESLVKLLSALSSASRSVRQAALNSSSILLNSIKNWWPVKGEISKSVVESLLEVIVKSGERILADSDGLEYLLQQIIGQQGAKGRKKMKSPKARDTKPAFFDPESLASFLMHELESDTQLQHTPLLLRVLQVGEDADRLPAICAMILERSFTDIETQRFVSPLSMTQRAASLEMLNVLNDPGIHHVGSQSDKAILISTLKSSTWKDEPELRQIALSALSKCVSSSTSVEDLQNAVVVLISAASTELDENCRKAALSTLEIFSLSSDVLLPFLKLPHSSHEQSKRQKSTAKSKRPLEAQNRTEESSSLCLHTLELLQWKRDIETFENFTRPVQTLIKEFMVLSKDSQTSAGDADNEMQGPAVASYGLQLCLNILLYISENSGLEKKVRKYFDTGLIVDCASSSADHAVSTIALDLLRSRIDSCPEDALDHILKTVETVCRIVSDESDKYSALLASKSLSTAAAAWISGGNSIHDLVPNVIDSIQDTSYSRKYAILGALVDSMPSSAAETMASISYHLMVSDQLDEDSWKRDAAVSILSKNNKATCISALGCLLQMCLKEDTSYNVQQAVNAMTYKHVMNSSSALQRMQQKDPSILASYETIMKSILRQLQLIGKARAKSSDPHLLDVENGAYKILNALRETMDSTQFIECMLRSLLHKDTTEAMARKSLSLLTKVASDIDEEELTHTPFYQCVHDTVGACISIVEVHGKKSEITRQVALETLGAFSRKFGAHYHDIFLQAIPATVDLVNENELPAVRGTALVCLSAYIHSMKNAVIPMVPRIVPAIILGSSAALEEDATQTSRLDLSASLTALEALSQNLGSFMAPNMMDVLRILLHKNVVNSDDDSCRRLGKSCRSIISAHIPARLLLNPLCEMMNENEGLQGSSLTSLFELAAVMIYHMDSTAVATYHAKVFSLILQGLDIRRTGTEELDMADSIESSVVDAMVQLILKLNETKFKPLFYRFVEWATTNPAGQKDPSPDRKIAFFHTISVLTENLKSVFTPYYTSLVKPIVQILEDQQAALLLRVLVLKSLTRCFIYDTSGFLDEHHFSKLLDPLVEIMKTQHGEPENEQKYSELVRDAAIDDMIPSSDVRASLGVLARYTIACISQMTTASGSNSESRWRPLHHAVLMVTRASHADARLAALETTMAICDALQEEYLTLLPEALPFLSELLEDEDSRIEKRTVEVLKKMEDVSGEDLKQYLQ